MSVIKNLIIDQTLSRTRDGYEAQISYQVEIPGNASSSKLYDALRFDGIPQFGDPHPTLPEVFVTNVTARPSTGASTDSMRVTVTYSVPTVDDIAENESDEETSSGTLAITSNNTSETVFQDINGELLKATYGVLRADGSNSTLSTKYAEAEVDRPQMQADFSRTEAAIPKGAINTYLGAVNSVPWSGYRAKTWICSGITARQNKGKFDVEYSFNYKPNSWRLEVVVGLTPEEAEAIPINVSSGNGYARFDVYRSADFNKLGLSF